MPPVRVASASSGPRITVNTMVRQPRLIPTRILSLVDQRFVADKLLRDAGDAPGGAVRYYESPPLFAENDAELVQEFSEIPVAQLQVGEPKHAPARKRGLAVVISEEMRRRNQIDLVNKQIQMVKNTVIRAIDGTFMAALLGATGRNTLAATAAWDAASGTRIRGDIAEAKQLIIDEKRGFNPDTLLIGSNLATVLEGADEINRIFEGNVANLRPELVGQLPPRISGLDVFVTYNDLLADSAFVMERGIVGGIADERPLQSTELYLWKREAEVYRSDTLRQSAVFIDEPDAMTEITNVLT
jgi:hypothetical protein